MHLGGNSVLVTGGGSGIGLALAARFLQAGSEVVICGRRVSALHRAAALHPGLKTIPGDVATAESRRALVAAVEAEYPHLNVVVNNAGIQRRVKLAEGDEWDATHAEIAINLEAPIHLAALLIPRLRGRPRPAIVNVTSGLAFVPLADVPVYCATKAALHSFTLSLRRQLEAIPIEVVEILPPAVNTDLGGPGLHTFGVDVNEFADAVARRIEAGEHEIAYGFAQESSQATAAQRHAIFERMNAAR